jgi:hypothetical protein
LRSVADHGSKPGGSAAGADLRWYWNPPRGANIPVASVERATEQTGAHEKAWLKVSPCAAMRSMCGVTPRSAP